MYEGDPPVEARVKGGGGGDVIWAPALGGPGSGLLRGTGALNDGGTWVKLSNATAQHSLSVRSMLSLAWMEGGAGAVPACWPTTKTASMAPRRLE